MACTMIITKCNFHNIYLGYFDKHKCNVQFLQHSLLFKNKQIKSLLIFISNFHAPFMTIDGLFWVEYVLSQSNT